MNDLDVFHQKIEHARLLARFKLGVKRQLDLSISLDRLQNEPDYAGPLFDQLEERIEDEDLLATLVELRARMQSKAVDDPPPATTGEVEAESESTSRYRFGPRS